MDDKVIEVKNLVRDFSSTHGFFLKRSKKIIRAVDSISFHVKKGEIFGLLGPNGAGKTTTIKILTTLLAPTSGEAKVLGFHSFGEEKFLRPHINFVYGGERNLYWRITGRENLEYFSDLYKIDKKTRNKRIPALLELVNLSDRADERVETYSKGMKQRLQIARGLVNDPDILFLDEPSIGLDPVGARELREIIRNLAGLGKTVVITTHYMYEADELCDRIAIINKGRLITLDTPQNLKKTMESLAVIEVTVEILLKEKIEILKNISNVSHVTTKASEQAEIIEIQCREPYKVMGEIIKLFEEDKILNMITRETTLEDVYVKYVGG
ncbi:daunorubicin ABC transporter ATPase [Paenibacillus dendritiformis]|uniref:ABC transporter ATP-binding protein n=1 Tax=Paenibacillus dendritiformis TaxID=130049 RepID=UPI0018CD79AB|nr:ABC transporter ATP-binding protein [Paenibacillus dendritiformis]MBG9792691.1 daunorubicin ABC transporter ATPase [Paenibacillus dendritiformis]